MELTLEILGATQDELKAIAAKLPTAGALRFRPQKDGLFFWKWKGFAVDGAADGLSDSASQKSEYWAFTPETNQRLVELLRGFYEIAPRRFYLYAAVSGDLPKRDTELEFAELLEVVAGGHLANRVRYLVRPETPKITPSEETEA